MTVTVSPRCNDVVCTFHCAICRLQLDLSFSCCFAVDCGRVSCWISCDRPLNPSVFRECNSSQSIFLDSKRNDVTVIVTGSTTFIALSKSCVSGNSCIVLDRHSESLSLNRCSSGGDISSQSDRPSRILQDQTSTTAYGLRYQDIDLSEAFNALSSVVIKSSLDPNAS